MSTPYRVDIDASDRLFVGDNSNHRVLAFNSVPVGNGAAASYAIGQAGLGAGAANQGGGGGASTLFSPMASRVIGLRLYSADYDNNRVTIYDCQSGGTFTFSPSFSASPTPSASPVVTATPSFSFSPTRSATP